MKPTVTIPVKDLDAITARLAAVIVEVCKGKYPLTGQFAVKRHPGDTLEQIVVDLKRLADGARV